MNYTEAMDEIGQWNSKGIALGLERISALLDLLDNPQEKVRYIHVAGTNGKGSVCAFLDSVLRQAGFCVGRYSSPTLYTYLERFQINGSSMKSEVFADLFTIVHSACSKMQAQGMELPTVFEVETAIAFLYFKQQHCDYVLLEVGMGGRLDSTNVIQHPVLSVITSISLDHTKMLGNALEAIALEKAGIIKQNCAVVLAPQKPEVMEVLLEQCKACDVVPTIVELQQLHSGQWGLEGQVFSYRHWEFIQIRLNGLYQQINAAVALEALQILAQKEPSLNEYTIRDGLAQTVWPGRFEIIQQVPLFIVDGAHNPAGAKMLADTVQELLLPYVREKGVSCQVWLLMGVFRDKDYNTIGQIMRVCSDTLICFQPHGERGLASTELKNAMCDYYSIVVDCKTPEAAVEYVLQHAADTDIIISFGSLSTIKVVQDAAYAWEVEHHGAWKNN